MKEVGRLAVMSRRQQVTKMYSYVPYLTIRLQYKPRKSFHDPKSLIMVNLSNVNKGKPMATSTN